jgi:hypothetical protein
VSRKKLLDGNFGADNRFATKEADAALLESDDAVTGGMNGEVAADFSADAGALGHADLTDNNLAGLDFLAAEQLNAEALAGTIMDVFGCTASLDM